MSVPWVCEACGATDQRMLFCGACSTHNAYRQRVSDPLVTEAEWEEGRRPLETAGPTRVEMSPTLRVVRADGEVDANFYRRLWLDVCAQCAATSADNALLRDRLASVEAHNVELVARYEALQAANGRLANERETLQAELRNVLAGPPPGGAGPFAQEPFPLNALGHAPKGGVR